MTIEKIRENPQHLGGLVSKLNEIIDVVNSLANLYPEGSLTGGEKEILCKVCNWSNHNLKDGICENCIKKIAVQETKSNTLRAEVVYYLFQTEDATANVKAEKILSLVKEHLEKEINDHEYFCDEYGCDTAVKRIIKNL